MAERAILELKAELQEAKKKMTRFQHSVESGFNRIEGQQRQMNKRQKSWTQSLKTTAKQAATAYASFEGIQLVTRGIGHYFQSWTGYMNEVEQAADKMATAVKDLQMMTDPAEWDKTISRLEQVIQTIPQKPQETIAGRTNLVSMLPDFPTQKRSQLGRYAGMMGAVSQVKQQSISKVFGKLATYKAAKGGPESVKAQNLANIVMKMLKLAPGGPKVQQKAFKYAPRVLKQAMGRKLTPQQALGVGLVGARYESSVARGTMRPSRVLQQLAGKGKKLPKQVRAEETIWGRLGALYRMQKRGQFEKGEWKEIFGKRMGPTARVLAGQFPRIKRYRKKLKGVIGGRYFQKRLRAMAKDPQQLGALARQRAKNVGKVSKYQNVPMQKAATARTVLEEGLSHWAVAQGIAGPPVLKAAEEGAETQWGIVGGGPIGMFKGYMKMAEFSGLSRKQKLAMAYKYIRMMSMYGKSLLPKGGKRLLRTAFPRQYTQRGATGEGPASVREAREAWQDIRQQGPPHPRQGVAPAAPGVAPTRMPSQGGQTQKELERIRKSNQKTARAAQQAAQNSTRRNHSSDRAGAQP